MKAYPLLLEPILKPRVWGGRSLEDLGKALPEDQVIGESWELCDLPKSIEDGRSVIANGPFLGKTLRNAIELNPQMMMGTAQLSEEGGFPLLIKYLDARANLSVQVHPTQKYVEDHPGARVKSEAWVVVKADPGAVIFKGVKADVTRGQFAKDLCSDAVVDDLIAIPVQAGDCHYLPSGTCHALGGGIVVAEVQTPSDTTFRVYDWGRTGRELHIEQALECIEFGLESPKPPRLSRLVDGDGTMTTSLAETEDFTIERFGTVTGAEIEVVTNDMPMIWMVIAGEGVIDGGGVETPLVPGATVLAPAGMQDGIMRLQPGCALLCITLPPPTRGLIA